MQFYNPPLPFTILFFDATLNEIRRCAGERIKISRTGGCNCTKCICAKKCIENAGESFLVGDFFRERIDVEGTMIDYYEYFEITTRLEI